MKNYELSHLISPEISETEINRLVDEITDFIKSQSGDIKKISEPSKKELGYYINKKSEAFLSCVCFSLDPEKITALESFLKEKKGILRYIIIAKKKHKEYKGEFSKRTDKTTAEGTAVNELEVREKKSEKIELKEIDQKIEEILK